MEGLAKAPVGKTGGHPIGSEGVNNLRRADLKAHRKKIELKLPGDFGDLLNRLLQPSDFLSHDFLLPLLSEDFASGSYLLPDILLRGIGSEHRQVPQGFPPAAPCHRDPAVPNPAISCFGPVLYNGL